MRTCRPPTETGLPAEIAGWIEPRSDSRFLLLERAADALLWRLALIDEAVDSLDVKYFIWKGDAVGTLVFSRILEAAMRGVRVRLLVDDLNLDESDEVLAGLSAHPNIAIKLFNPPRTRHLPGALMDYASSFRELNKRMHNKAVICDGHLAVIGGRNIGNEYYGLSRSYNFIDLDVLAVGPIIPEVGESFDAYWNSPLAVPIEDLVDEITPADLEEFIAADHHALDEAADLLSSYPMRRQPWKELAATLPDSWHSGRAHYLQDEPISAGEETARLPDFIDAVAGPVHDELVLVSAYRIPVEPMLANVKELCDQGVTVKIITGTMESVNHTASYAHYRKYIKPILATGAELYEIDANPEPLVRSAADVPPINSGYMAVHVKGAVADRKACFIGSLNLDPRALVINTEGGLFIESEGLSGQVADWFATLASPVNAWRVREGSDGEPKWEGDGEVRDGSPNRGGFHTIKAAFYQALPIESQL